MGLKFDMDPAPQHDSIVAELDSLTADQLISKAVEKFAEAKASAAGRGESSDAGLMLEANTLALVALFRQNQERSSQPEPAAE